MPVVHFNKTFPQRNDKAKSSLRNKLSDIQVVVIDEVSMVSSRLLLHIHRRLIEIFGCFNDNLFAGLTVIFCGDFFQLPPIQ